MGREGKIGIHLILFNAFRTFFYLGKNASKVSGQTEADRRVKYDNCHALRFQTVLRFVR